MREHRNEHGPLTPANPSRTATARVKDPAPVPTTCPHCCAPVELTTEQAVYGTTYSEWPHLYACTECDARVGLHPFTAIPLGTLADKATRDARMAAKRGFECIWQHKHMSRTDAYAWLAHGMGLAVAECHFGMFNVAQCERAAELVREFYRDMQTQRRA